MKLLQERIRREGKVLPGNIIKVDGFLNHRVDTALLREIAREFKRRFHTEGLTAVLDRAACSSPNRRINMTSPSTRTG